MKSRFPCDFFLNREQPLPGSQAPAWEPVSAKLRFAPIEAELRESAFPSWNLGTSNQTPGASTVDLQTDSSGRPICVYVPQNYEPHYAYPLIVWLHGGGGNERDLLSVLPMISEQNYIGLSFRGRLPANSLKRGAFRWSDSTKHLAELEADLYSIVCRLRGDYHIHSERIFPAGFDDGGTLALRLLLRRPEWFGGAVCLAGRFPASRNSLARFRDLRGKRVLLAGGAHDVISPPDAVVRAGRLLHGAGLTVSTRVVNSGSGHETNPALLHQVDDWLMEGICTTV